MPAPGICPGRRPTAARAGTASRRASSTTPMSSRSSSIRSQPKIVFASACSGIYKSENGAELFKRIEGIPSTARRTRVLKQDPAHREVVYAGTTEGLYKTVDGGKSFQRMTGPEVIVNDVFVDPRGLESCAAGHRSRRRACEPGRGRPALRRPMRASPGARWRRCWWIAANPGAALCRGGERQELWRSISLQRWRRALGADQPTGWMGAMSMRWPSRRRERSWRGPITASLRWRRAHGCMRAMRRELESAQHDSEHAGEDGHRDALWKARQCGEAGEGHGARD